MRESRQRSRPGAARAGLPLRGITGSARVGAAGGVGPLETAIARSRRTAPTALPPPSSTSARATSGATPAAASWCSRRHPTTRDSVRRLLLVSARIRRDGSILQAPRTRRQVEGARSDPSRRRSAPFTASSDCPPCFSRAPAHYGSSSDMPGPPTTTAIVSRQRGPRRGDDRRWRPLLPDRLHMGVSVVWSSLACAIAAGDRRRPWSPAVGGGAPVATSPDQPGPRATAAITAKCGPRRPPPRRRRSSSLALELRQREPDPVR
jgi:hypothetical protein